MIPCIDCLILPICKHKVAVKCRDLYTWFNADYPDAELHMNTEKRDIILEMLPKCFTISAI